MSTSAPTTPRLLESSVRQMLVEGGSLRDVNILLQSESDERQLPAVVISAASKPQTLAVQDPVTGEYASELDLKLECLVDATLSDSPRLIKALVETVRIAMENASGVTGWTLFILDYQGDDPTVEKSHRSTVITYAVTVLPE